MENKYYKGFNRDGFIEWLEDKYGLNSFTVELLDNIIDYAHKHEHVSKDQFAYFVSDLVPEIEFLDVAKFCEDTILTRDTLRQLGRAVLDIKNLPKEFNFKSNVNVYGIVYHAIEQEHGYKVTCDAGANEWDFTKEEMHRSLLSGDYEIIR